jgi:hypothetical protein
MYARSQQAIFCPFLFKTKVTLLTNFSLLLVCLVKKYFNKDNFVTREKTK